MLAFWILPDTPMNAWFLTEEEKYHAVTRLASNKTGIVSKVWKWNQAIEAVTDVKTWLLFLFNISINVPNGGEWIHKLLLHASAIPPFKNRTKWPKEILIFVSNPQDSSLLAGLLSIILALLPSKPRFLICQRA
jgi:hypothetical protein